MTDIKKINKFFGDQFDNKYTYTSAGGFIYYHWNKSNDRQLIPMGYNWSGDFDIPEPIYFESSHRSTGKLKKVEFPAVKELNQEKRTVEFPQTKPTGYLTPRFSFINAQFFIYDNKGDEYERALELFDIKEEETISPDKIPLISNYMGALHNQLNRQAQELTNLNRQIANVLKVYYYESEQLALNNLKNISIEERKRKGNDWGDISHNVKSLFQSLVTKGASSELIETHWMLEELKNNSYVSEHLIEATIHGILTLSKKKDPLINMAIQLAYKINPLESILEDAFLNNRIRANKDYLKENLTRVEIIQKAHDLKDNGMSVEKMFIEIKKWLQTDLGLNNEELQYRFGFQLHTNEIAHDSFNRFVNENRHKHI